MCIRSAGLLPSVIFQITQLGLVLSDIAENSLHGCESLTVVTTVRNSLTEVTLNLLLKCGFTFFLLSFCFSNPPLT